MVSIENGEYRLSCIEKHPSGKIKLVFEFDPPYTNPAYGKIGKPKGEIPILRHKECFPIPGFFQLTKSKQDEIFKNSLKRVARAPAYENLGEEELKERTFTLLSITALSAPRIDPCSKIFDLYFDILAGEALLNDSRNEINRKHSDKTELDRLTIRKSEFDWKEYLEGDPTMRKRQLKETLMLFPNGHKFLDIGSEFVRRIEGEYTDGIPTGFKNAIAQYLLSRQTLFLEDRVDGTSAFSEETYKLVRSYNVGMGSTLEISAAIQGIVVPETLRSNHFFHLMRSRALEIIGLTHDLLGLMRDTDKNEVVENHMLRRIIREGISLGEALASAQKSLYDLHADLKMITNKILTAFPDNAALGGYVQCLLDLVDGHTVSFVVAAQMNYRNGKNLVDIVSEEKALEKTVADNDLLWCREKLKKLSRSFALVTAQLPIEIREVVSLFYVVLRALDTIEDDMSVEAEIKQRELIAFHQHLLQEGYTLKGFGTNPDEVDLLENFDRVNRCLSTLDSKYTKTIISVCRDMGLGMEKFVGGKAIISFKDLEEYAQIVAGLVGEGITEICTTSGLENQEGEISRRLMTSRGSTIGILLHKAHIIRDLKEDFQEDRFYWPLAVVLKYLPSVSALFDDQFKSDALKCLNHLILNALTHVEESLQYLIELKNSNIFRFCAIPTIMAIYTLAHCYNNYEVFEGKIKISKAEGLKAWERTACSKDLLQLVQDHLQFMLEKIIDWKTSDKALRESINELIEFCLEKSDLSAGVKEN